jgi:uncharacterized integral membrane protein
MSSDPPQQSKPGRSRGGKGKMDVDRRFEAKTIAAIILGVVIIAFAVANSQKVQVHFIVATAHWPLVLVIVISILVGFLLGNLVRRRTHRPAKPGRGQSGV